jgi:hypothetical protein
MTNYYREYLARKAKEKSELDKQWDEICRRAGLPTDDEVLAAAAQYDIEVALGMRPWNPDVLNHIRPADPSDLITTEEPS